MKELLLLRPTDRMAGLQKYVRIKQMYSVSINTKHLDEM